MRPSVVILTAALMVACSKNGSSPTSPTTGDAVPPALPTPPPDYDVRLEEVRTEGCLNLQAIFEKIRQLPESTVLRRYTASQRLEPRDHSKGSIRRNFTAIASFSHFMFEEKGLALASEDLPLALQADCSTANLAIDPAGMKPYQLETVEKESRVQLVGEDGQRIVYELAGPRELVVTTDAFAMDPCPDFAKVKTTTTRVLSWGSQEDLDRTPIQIERDLLRRISIGVADMPSELLTLVAQDSGPLIEVPARSLRSLASSTLETSVLQCPLRAKPPSGEEPPPSQDASEAPPIPGTSGN